MPKSAAQRMREKRERDRRGEMVAQIGVPEAVVEMLIEAGYLDPIVADQRDKVARAIERLHAALAVFKAVEN